MDTNARREMLRDPYNSEDIEVSSDGRTVWINGSRGALARFCPISFELANPENGDLKVAHKMVDPTNPTQEEWDRFMRLVQTHYHTTISNEHRPLYIPKT